MTPTICFCSSPFLSLSRALEGDLSILLMCSRISLFLNNTFPFWPYQPLHTTFRVPFHVHLSPRRSVPFFPSHLTLCSPKPRPMLSEDKQISLFAEPSWEWSLAALSLCACPWPGQHIPGMPSLHLPRAPFLSFTPAPDRRRTGGERLPSIHFVNSFWVLGATGF